MNFPDFAAGRRPLPVPHSPHAVDQCRRLNLLPGDVVETRTTASDGSWADIELTLLHLRAQSAVWAVRRRSQHRPEWVDDGVSSRWTLDAHDWYRRPHPTDALRETQPHLIAAARFGLVYPRSPYKRPMVDAVMRQASEHPEGVLSLILPHAALWLNDFDGWENWLARFAPDEVPRRLPPGSLCAGQFVSDRVPFSEIVPVLVATHPHWSPVRPAADTLLRALCRWADFRIRNRHRIFTPGGSPAGAADSLFKLATHLPFTAEEWDRLSTEADFPLGTFVRHPPPGVSSLTLDIWSCAVGE